MYQVLHYLVWLAIAFSTIASADRDERLMAKLVNEYQANTIKNLNGSACTQDNIVVRKEWYAFLRLGFLWTLESLLLV